MGMGIHYEGNLNNMSDYIIALFVDSEVREYKLSKLIVKQSEIVLNRELINSNFDLSLPLHKKNNKWYITPYKAAINLKINGQEAIEKPLNHGDYITVTDIENNIQYSILAILLERHSINFKKLKLEKNKNIFIGRLPESDIYFNINNNVSRKHAALRIEDNGNIYIEDLSGKIGVYVNGKRTNSTKLKVGDIVFIVGLKIIFMTDYIAVSDNISGTTLMPIEQFKFSHPIEMAGQNKAFFARSPRIMKTLESGIYEIDLPPTTQKNEKIPIIFTIGPSMTMAVAMLTSFGFAIVNATTGGSTSSIVTSGIVTISMLSGALFWPILINNYQKRLEKAEENYRRVRYSQYINEQGKILEEKYQRNIRILNDTLFPGPQTIFEFLKNKENERRLWERTPRDSDFLEIRLGKGERVFDLQISVPKQGFVLQEDPLCKEPAKLVEKYSILKNVPITVSLMEQKTIGLIGQRDKIIKNVKCMVLNIAALHSFDEVKMLFIYNENEKSYFEWVKDLPHVWSTDRGSRYVATNKNEVHQMFNMVDEILKERQQKQLNVSGMDVLLPQFIIFVADEKLVENEPLMRYLTNPQNTVGVSGVFIYGSILKLPKECETIIQNDDLSCGIYCRKKYSNKFIRFTADEASREDLLDFIQNLIALPVKVDNTNLSIPEKVSFLDMYKVGNVEELNIEQLWHENLSYKSLAVPIGLKAGGELFSLDIHEHYHGCHGLVAGMTGSGKSEFLQTYIISAAINFHPYDLSFVLIDYKGGGMANCFDGIPHIAGKITNLSGSQLNRSLKSIKAELNRRQLLFNEYGINHIDKYQKLYKAGVAGTPLPHLVIISDEFAQLKAQQPDFMRELIDVAQIGRSLGIHLILATQKPAGLVDDQIWSNSKFRVCLKVLDKYDSNEMIKRPDAAMIKLPGRCYVQVGYDEIFEYIQSGYSGVEYTPTNGYIDEEERTISLVDNTALPIRTAHEEISVQKSGKSQLEAIISNIIEIAKKNNIESLSLWIKPLEQEIELCEINESEKHGFDGQRWIDTETKLSVAVGLADFPKQQKQLPLKIDLIKDGHVIIYGASGTGKTTFLQTLVYNLAVTYSPDVINMYIFDFEGRTLGYFSELPHCGGVIFADDEKKVDYTLNALLDLMEQRKLLFSDKNVGSYESYISAAKEKLPAVLLILDNYSAFKERFFRLEDTIVKLASDGKTYGIFLVITGNSKGAVYYRVTEHVSNLLTLRLNDSLHYREVLNTSVSLDIDNIKGRGLTVVGDVVEFQTALVVKTNNEAERITYIRKQIAKMNLLWKGKKATLVILPDSPNCVNLVKPAYPRITGEIEIINHDVMNRLPLVQINEHTLYVGDLASNNQPQGIELKNLHTFFIGGFEKTGKTEFLKFLMLNSKEYSNRQVILIDRENQELKGFSEQIMVERYISLATEFDCFVSELKKIVEERYAEYQNIRKNVETEGELLGCMLRYEKIFIFINGFSDFFEMITDDAAEEFARIISTCKGLNIYFITLDNFIKVSDFSITEMYIRLVKINNGIIMGGAINKQHIFTFENMNHKDREKVLSNGQGILFSNDKYAAIKIPQ